jgi:hypothetical protein
MYVDECRAFEKMMVRAKNPHEQRASFKQGWLERERQVYTAKAHVKCTSSLAMKCLDGVRHEPSANSFSVGAAVFVHIDTHAAGSTEAYPSALHSLLKTPPAVDELQFEVKSGLV